MATLKMGHLSDFQGAENGTPVDQTISKRDNIAIGICHLRFCYICTLTFRWGSPLLQNGWIQHLSIVGQHTPSQKQKVLGKKKTLLFLHQT